MTPALHFLTTPLGFDGLLAVAVVLALWRCVAVSLRRRL